MKVRLFAALREIAGASELESSAPDVGSLLDQLSHKFGPEFERIISAGAVVVDGETVDRERTLHPDDDVALLPPVSGGECQAPQADPVPTERRRGRRRSPAGRRPVGGAASSNRERRERSG